MHNPIEYVPTLLILLYIPFVCISDWRTRTFNFLYLIPLMVINVPLVYLYLAESPLRNYYLMGMTLVLCLILLGVALYGAIGGADFWFASLIMITVPFNPFLSIRRYFPLDFFYTLLLTAVYLPIVIYIYHIKNRDKLPIWKMLTAFPGKFPYMLPISFAFIATLIMEVMIFP